MGNTTVLTPACAAIFPTSSGLRCSSLMFLAGPCATMQRQRSAATGQNCRRHKVPAQAIAGPQNWGANRTVGCPMNKTGYTQFKGSTWWTEPGTGPTRSRLSK